jgi:predicted phage tail protein
VDVTRRLADARALRTSLLKQLANAITTQQIDSLQAQIHDAEASISSDQATLRTLNHQISFSQVSVTINAAAIPPIVGHSGGFTIGTGAHDAGRVLMVAAGVGLIVLAVLVPVALLAALAWWAGSAVRRRRREHALDLA